LGAGDIVQEKIRDYTLCQSQLLPASFEIGINTPVCAKNLSQLEELMARLLTRFRIEQQPKEAGGVERDIAGDTARGTLLEGGIPCQRKHTPRRGAGHQ